MTLFPDHSDNAPMNGASIEAALARGALVILASAGLYLLLGLGLYRFWHPDGAFYHELFATTIVSPRVIRPEPHEKRLFMLVVLSSPALLLLLWSWLRAGRIARLIDRCAPVILAGATAAVVALAVAALAANNPSPEPQLPTTAAESFAVVSNVNAGFYFYGTFLYRHPYLYALGLFPLALGVLVNQRVQRFLEAQKTWANAAIVLFAAVIAVWMLVSETFSFPYTTENRYDFGEVYYPMVQVYHGAVLLTDHFTSNYGLYPQFLLPLFKAVGLSVATFSGTMALLTVGCFSVMLLALWRLVTNRLLLLLTYTAVIFYGFCYSRTITAFDPYFANIPIRLVTTMTALGLALCYRRGWGRRQTLAAQALLACGVLWCPDFGLVSLVAFTLFLGYLRIDPARPRRTALALGEVLVLGLVALAGVFAGFALLVRAVYGATPDLALLFNAMTAFSVLGMNMLPMPLLHPWNLVALTFAGGLLATLPQLLRGTQDEASAGLFLFTVLGIGAFSYYQGRSHNWNLLPVLLYAIPVWGICADRLLSQAGTNRRLCFPLAVLVFLLGSSLPQLAYAWRPLAELVGEREDKAANLAVERRIEQNAEYIRGRTAPGDKVLIYTDPAWQGLYHGLAQRGSAFNPSYLDLFWRDDYRRFLVALRSNTATRIYLEPGTKAVFPPSLAKPVKVLLECCYDGTGTNGVMEELSKKGEETCRSCLVTAGFDQLLLQTSGR